MLIYILLGLSLVFNIYFLLKSRKYKRLLKNQGSKKYKQKYDDLLNDYNRLIRKQPEKYKNKVEETKSSFQPKQSNFSNELKKDKYQKDNYEKLTKNIVTQNITEDKKSTPISLDVSRPETKIIYLPAPFEDKRFASEDVSDFVKSTSLYKAEINKELNQGELSIHESADLSRAINSPSIYLDTACIYENAHFPEARTVEVIEKGTVVLEDNDWLVKKKIRIKFN